jgi:diguanylate cyclase (GGDEF)-like protein
MMHMERDARRAILVRFALVVACSAAGAGAAAWYVQRAVVQTRSLIRGHEVLMRIERTLGVLEGAETRARDYLLTGEPHQLKLFRGEVEEVGQQLDRLSAIVPANGQRGALIGRLNRLVAERVAALQETIALYDAAGSAAALARVRAARARDLSGEIHRLAASIREAQERNLTRRAALAEMLLWVMILLAGSVAISQLLLMAFSHRLIARERLDHQATVGHLENLAMTDPLTGLGNRRALERALESAVARAKRHGSDLSVILLDVDHFKHCNDRFGHEVGDDVLRAVAGVLLGAVRTEDFVGRYGGEEFLVVLPDADEAGSVRTAERIRIAVRALSLPLPPVTISAGVASLRDQSLSTAGLIAAADDALYVSKRSGRDRVTHFAHEPRIEAADPLETEPTT